MTTSRSDLSHIWLFIFPFLSLITCDTDVASHSALSDVTDKVFGGPKNGTVAAFGDFNSDQHVDMFFIVNEGMGVEIFFTHSDNIQTDGTSINRMNESITSVVPGDFDGDSRMDVLITTRPKDRALDRTAPTSAYVYWGTSLSGELVTEVSTNMIDQPLVMDYNADMIPDLFGAEMDGKRYFWTCNRNTDPKSFSKIQLTGEHSTDPLRIPSSHAFVDLDNNYAAELLVTSRTGSNPQFEVWEMLQDTSGAILWQFQKLESSVTGTWANIGQSTFADIDADGHLDHIVPVCRDAECSSSFVYAKTSREENWTKVLDTEDLNLDGHRWGFIPPSQHLSNTVDIPMTLRAGDINLDNYPDFVCILRKGSTDERAVVVLQNVGGKLKPSWPSPSVSEIKGPVLAALIDLTNTGLLDVLVVSQPTPNDQPQTYILGNHFSIDAYFVTVQVLSGLVCEGSCPNGKYTYGVNQPGPQIHYDTTSSNGGRQRSMAAQLCQSSYLALQLPHVVMGLGQNPNFVDYLTVGVPSPNGDPRERRFTSLIPNSQLIVIPKPLNKPEDWTSKLLITPGQSVILTGGILIGTCIFIAVLAAALQFMEKREDEIQKRQESHRFHFDAM